MKNPSTFSRLALILLLCLSAIDSNAAISNSKEEIEKLSPLNFSKGKLNTGDSLNGKPFTCKNEWIEIREEFQDEQQFTRIIADGVSYRKNRNRPQNMIPEAYQFDLSKLNRVSLIRKWKKYNDFILYSEYQLPDYDAESPYKLLDPNTGNVYDSTDQYGNLVFPPRPKASSYFRIHNLKTGKTIEMNKASFFMQSKEKVWISYFDMYFGQYPLFSLYDLKSDQFAFAGIPAGSLWKHQEQIATYPELKNTKIIERKNKGLNPENTCIVVSENIMSTMNMVTLQRIPSANYEWFKESIAGLRIVFAGGKFGIEDEQHKVLLPLNSDSVAIWTESLDHDEQVWTKIYHNGNIYHYQTGRVPVKEKNTATSPYRYSAQSTAHVSDGLLLFSAFDASELLHHRPYISVFADVEMMDSVDAQGNLVYPPKPPVQKEIEAYHTYNQRIAFTDTLSTRVTVLGLKMKYHIRLENINRFEPYSYQIGTMDYVGGEISKQNRLPLDSIISNHHYFFGHTHLIKSISFCSVDSSQLKIETTKGIGIYDVSQARWLIAPQYEHVHYLESFQSYLLSCGGKMGLTDSWGIPIFPVEFQTISYDPHKDYFRLDDHYFVYRNPQYSALRGVMHEEEVMQTRGFSDVNQSFLEAKFFEGRILLSYGNRVVGPLEIFDPETGDQFLIEDTREIISKYGYKQYGINLELGKKIFPDNKLNQQFQLEFRNGYLLASNAAGDFYLYNTKWQCFDSSKRGSLTILGKTTLVKGEKQIALGNDYHEVVDANYDAAMYSETPPYVVNDARLYYHTTLIEFPDGFIPFRLISENLVHAVKKENKDGKEILRHQMFFIREQQQPVAIDSQLDAWSLAYKSTGKSMVLGYSSPSGEIVYRLLDVSQPNPILGAPFSADILWKGEKVAYFLEKTNKGFLLYSADKLLLKSGLASAPSSYLATDSTLHFELSGKWYGFHHGKEIAVTAPLQSLYFGENEVGRHFFYRTQNGKIELLNQKGESLAISNWIGNHSAELHTAEGLENIYFLSDTTSKKRYLLRWNKMNLPEFVFSEAVDSFQTIYANSDTRVLIWTKGETHVCDQNWNVLMTLPYTAETKNSELGLTLLLLRPKKSNEPFRVFHPTYCELSNTSYPENGIDLSYNEVENIGELWVTGKENNAHLIYSYKYDGTLLLTGKKIIANGSIKSLPFGSYWINQEVAGELYYLGPEYEFRDTFSFGKLTMMSDKLHFLVSDRQNKITRLYQLTSDAYIELPLADLDSAMEYSNGSIIQYWKNNKSGLYFTNIKKLLPPVYTQVVGPFNLAMNLITCDGNLISTITGEIIFDNTFKRCEFPEGKYLLSQNQNGTWWICSNQANSPNFLKKKQLPSNIKKWVGFAGIEDWHKFMDHSGMVGIYNVKTDEWILQPKFKDVRAAYAGNHLCFFYSQGSYWGVCDSTGKIIIADTFDSIDLQEAYPSGTPYFTARKNGQYSLYNINGKALLPSSYPEIEGGNFPLVLVTQYANDKQTPLTGLYDVSKGKWLYPLSKVEYSFTEDPQGKKVIYVEQNGKRIKVIYP